MVLYIRGLSFDISEGKFVATGILAVRSEPTTATVFVNDELKREGEGDIKFLKPGEYALTLSQAGYFDWTKRINVRPNEVVWAQGDADKIHLLYKDQNPHIITENVTAFHTFGNNLLYLSGNRLVQTSVSSQEQSQTFQLPFSYSSMVSSPDNNLYFFSTSTEMYLYDRRNQNGKIVESFATANFTAKFSLQNQLYLLYENKLYQVLADGSKKLIRDNVKQFAFQGNSLYYVRQTPQGDYLAVSDIGTSNEFPVIKPFPTFKNSDILVNFQKEILIVGDGALYKANAQLEKLTDGIVDWKFDPEANNLVIVHSGELSYYDFKEKTLQLINRSGSPIRDPLFEPQLRYVFFSTNDSVRALEIDKRGHQNNYTLSPAAAASALALDSEKQHLLFQDGNSLKKIKIR